MKLKGSIKKYETKINMVKTKLTRIDYNSVENHDNYRESTPSQKVQILRR